MAKAKHASTLGIHLPNTIIEEIDRRAKLVGYTRSKYAGALITRWYARGAQPVLAAEAEALEPTKTPDGSLSWLGASPKPGHSMNLYADDAVTEKKSEPASESSKKKAG